MKDTYVFLVHDDYSRWISCFGTLELILLRWLLGKRLHPGGGWCSYLAMQLHSSTMRFMHFLAAEPASTVKRMNFYYRSSISRRLRNFKTEKKLEVAGGADQGAQSSNLLCCFFFPASSSANGRAEKLGQFCG